MYIKLPYTNKTKKKTPSARFQPSPFSGAPAAESARGFDTARGFEWLAAADGMDADRLAAQTLVSSSSRERLTD